MKRLGQSSVEYLTTYGWMIIAVAVLGSVVYTGMGPNCRLTVSGATGNFPTAADIGQYSNQTVVMDIENPQDQQIDVNSINFSRNGTVLASVPVDKQINGEASEPVSTDRFSTSEGCNSFTASINYQTEGLENLESSFEISGLIKLLALRPIFDINPQIPEVGSPVEFDASDSVSTGEIESYEWEFGDGSTATGMTVEHTYDQGGQYEVELTLTDSQGNTESRTETVYVGGVIRVSGGSLEKLGISNTLAVSCIGGGCSETSSTDDTAVETSGGRIEGTLFTEELIRLNSGMCISSKSSFNTEGGCSKVESGLPEELSDNNYNMTGSLNATVIKPFSSTVCIGSSCPE